WACRQPWPSVLSARRSYASLAPLALPYFYLGARPCARNRRDSPRIAAARSARHLAPRDDGEGGMAAFNPGIAEIVAAALFAVAWARTFSTCHFQRLARVNPANAGLWHLLGEVEVVFGFWAMVLLLFLVAHGGTGTALHYLESRNFTEPAFVFVIMVI